MFVAKIVWGRYIFLNEEQHGHRFFTAITKKSSSTHTPFRHPVIAGV